MPVMAEGPWAERAQIAREIISYVAARPSRIGEAAWWLRNRSDTTMSTRAPWWPRAAITGVGEALPPAGMVFEFGGGGSTLWLHDLGARVICVEHDREWFESLSGRLPADVEMVLREPTTSGTVGSEVAPGSYFDAYVAEIDRWPDQSFDLVIVDGRARVRCGLAARSKVKRGGLLLLDDSDRPRYRELVDALIGWERTDYTGLKVGGGGVCQTSVWCRPIAP